MSDNPPLFAPPPGYSRVKVVRSFRELVTTPLANGVNALCWPRVLPGNFAEVAGQVGTTDDITSLDEALLQSLPLSPDGRVAADLLAEDLRRLREQGLAPTLDCIRAYPQEEDPGPVPLDVYSFHADSATVETDTYLCSYTEASSEGLRNEDALRCIDDPAARAALLKLVGGSDDEAFRDFLHENGYDLHYVARAGAQPFSFGLGNLWRIAVAHPGCPVPPCIHRAPTTQPGSPPRLLLIS